MAVRDLTVALQDVPEAVRDCTTTVRECTMAARLHDDAARRAHDHVIRHDGSAPRCRIYIKGADRGAGHPYNRVDRTPRQGEGRAPAVTDAGSSNRLIVLDGSGNSAYGRVSTLCVSSAVAAVVPPRSSEMIHHR